MSNRWLSLLDLIVPGGVMERPVAARPKASPKGAKRPAPPATPTVITVEVAGRPLPVTLRRHAAARRYTLRVDPRGEAASVTMPKRGTITAARDFVARHVGWLESQITASPAPPINLENGALLALRGVEHRLVLTGRSRGTVATGHDGKWPLIEVPGSAAGARRRLVAYLKAEAARDLGAAVARHAATLGVRPTAVRLKDTRSRWGSAATTGVLSFSWRLIMAPPFVLDYLAAHEVAHLKEMNHSDRFWALCYRLAPQSEAARDWLKANGRSLHRAI